jgi:hypothetical protein
VIFSHPRSGGELPTPDYMRGSRSWPFDTYSKLRQITFNYTGMKIDAVWTRTSAAPWVPESSPKVSFKRAIEFVNEEWNREPASPVAVLGGIPERARSHRPFPGQIFPRATP